MSRRKLLELTGCAAAAAALSPLPAWSADGRQAAYRTKAMGCFLGAAIADAMGGPVEIQHYKRIAKRYPDFRDFLPYRKPPGLLDLRPGYALDDEPGSITDDTFIRMDLARFVLANDPPHTAAGFAAWLVEHADFSNWWGQAVKPLKRIQAGEIAAEKAGMNHRQGGGGAWWQPIAILHAGDPEKASAVTADMCRIWKAPLERDILSSVVAGQAAAFRKGSTIDTVVEAVLADSGPLATKLFTRAVEVARKAKSNAELHEQIYKHCLVRNCSTAIDGPMPPAAPAADPAVHIDGNKAYTSISFAEQQPLALAYFVYGQGDPRKTVLSAVKGGRDADSIASNTASWLGALAGVEVWPREWVETVQQANLERMNLKKTANELVKKGLENETVALDRI